MTRHAEPSRGKFSAGSSGAGSAAEEDVPLPSGWEAPGGRGIAVVAGQIGGGLVVLLKVYRQKDPHQQPDDQAQHTGKIKKSFQVQGLLQSADGHEAAFVSYIIGHNREKVKS